MVLLIGDRIFKEYVRQGEVFEGFEVFVFTGEDIHATDRGNPEVSNRALALLEKSV